MPSEVLGEILLQPGLESLHLREHGGIGLDPPDRVVASPGLDGFERLEVVVAELAVAIQEVRVGLEGPKESVVGLGDPAEADQEEAAPDIELVALPQAATIDRVDGLEGRL